MITSLYLMVEIIGRTSITVGIAGVGTNRSIIKARSQCSVFLSATQAPKILGRWGAEQEAPPPLTSSKRRLTRRSNSFASSWRVDSFWGFSASDMSTPGSGCPLTRLYTSTVFDVTRQGPVQLLGCFLATYGLPFCHLWSPFDHLAGLIVDGHMLHHIRPHWTATVRLTQPGSGSHSTLVRSPCSKVLLECLPDTENRLTEEHQVPEHARASPCRDRAVPGHWSSPALRYHAMRNDSGCSRRLSRQRSGQEVCSQEHAQR